MQPKIFTFNSNRSPILNSVKLQSYFKECLKNCKDEIKKAERLMQKLGVPIADSTSRSVEELSAIIIQHINKS